MSVGCEDGEVEMEGLSDGDPDGMNESEGLLDMLGVSLGCNDGTELGWEDGLSDGCTDTDGCKLGFCDGLSLGDELGLA